MIHSDDLVEIARFRSATKAAMARSLLGDGDIRTYVGGELAATMLWHMSQATGGVRLYVEREDVERASKILAAPSEAFDPEADDSCDESPDEADDCDSERFRESDRAFRAAVIGIGLLPVLLHIYSTILLVRHGLMRSPRNWRVNVAIAINLTVFISVIVLILGIRSHGTGTITIGDGLSPGRPNEVELPENAPILGKSITTPIVPRIAD